MVSSAIHRSASIMMPMWFSQRMRGIFDPAAPRRFGFALVRFADGINKSLARPLSTDLPIDMAFSAATAALAFRWLALVALGLGGFFFGTAIAAHSS